MQTVKIVTSTLYLLLVLITSGLSQDNFNELRETMVNEQLKKRGIVDEYTLQAMQAVPRHLFVPEFQESRAYEDRPLPIGYGQTISQPYIVAFMTQVIELGKDFKVLEIGTGSGYQAAVLAEIVDSVYTIEIIEALGVAAIQRLKDIGYKNVTVKVADGYWGWEEHAPFDAIIVTAAAEFIPPPLIEQLKDGGKMIIPVGSEFMTQVLILIEKHGDDIVTRNLLPVRFVPFTRSDKD